MCDVLSSIQEVNSTGMAKVVDGVNIAEAFGGQCLDEVLFADAIETGLSQLLTALIDKEAVLIPGGNSYRLLEKKTTEALKGE